MWGWTMTYSHACTNFTTLNIFHHKHGQSETTTTNTLTIGNLPTLKFTWLQHLLFNHGFITPTLASNMEAHLELWMGMNKIYFPKANISLTMPLDAQWWKWARLIHLTSKVNIECINHVSSSHTLQFFKVS